MLAFALKPENRQPQIRILLYRSRTAYRDVTARLRVRNAGVRTEGNTRCQDGKNKEK